ncbi:MAG: hypothetical protein Q8928_12395 [Bacteroidota bacterium]|nr:hypothetical protein [Bacteroidota bacterium]
MESQIKYVELKTGYANKGPAWIGKVEFLKSGKTIYFNGHAFKGNGHGVSSDLETGEIYWISGVKKNGQDRHWAGNGKIMIDRTIVVDYLKIMDLVGLDPKKYVLVDIEKTDNQRFVDIENGTIDSVNILDKYQDLGGLSIDDLKSIIQDLKREESYTNPNNGRKFLTIKRLEAEKLLENLQSDN